MRGYDGSIHPGSGNGVENTCPVKVHIQSVFFCTGVCPAQVLVRQCHAVVGILQTEQSGPGKMIVVRFNRLLNFFKVKGAVRFEIKGLGLN